MRIGIDVSQIAHEGTGVARFTTGLIEAILKHEKNHEYIFLYTSLRKQINPELVEKIKNSKNSLKKLPVPPTLLNLLWNRLHRVKVEKIIGNVDWFISSDWTEPPSHCKKATIIHDLTFIRYPELVDSSISKTHTRRLRHVKKESDLIFADSFATKQDIIEYLSIPKEKIVVNYPGVSTVTPSIDDITKIQFKFNLHKPFILTVGKIEPRKNLKRLIQAYLKLKNPQVELIIAGPPGWEQLNIPEQRNIRFLGYVSDTTLAALYTLAQFFIYPSIWEGFGYPPVEAMRFRCPVLMSNTSSLKEIGNDGSALMFDPLNIEEIQEKMEQMITHEQLRKSLQVKGYHHSEKYTWDNYYQKLITQLEKHS